MDKNKGENIVNLFENKEKKRRVIDIHCHILPGIDDGSRDIAESVEIVRQLVDQGVTDVIATPHYVDGTAFESPRSVNLKLLTELRQALIDEGLKINVYLGNEIYISDNIAELVKAGKMSTMAGSKYLLVEFSLDEEFPNYSDYLQALMDHGFKVILAHPERYAIVQKDYDVVRNLYEMGVLMQCNLGSILGRYGKEAKKTIKKMIKDKIIFAFGSDIHRPSRSSYIAEAQKKLGKYYSEHELRWLLVGNPGKIIAGERK